jgi:hypothetical protein
MGITQFDELFPVVKPLSIALADGTTPKVVTTTGAQPLRFDEVWAISQSASDHVVTLWYRASGVNYRFRSVNVPANSGNGTLPSINVMAGVAGDLAGVPFIQAIDLYVSVDVALTGAETITIVALGGLL